MKILIIEDRKSLSDSIADYLEKEGFVCETAVDFEDAQMRINVYDYDVILVDIMLPDGSGLDLVRELKEQHSKSGIVIVSAKDALDDKISLFNHCHINSETTRSRFLCTGRSG